jgi:hypothetical protein
MKVLLPQRQIKLTKMIKTERDPQASKQTKMARRPQKRKARWKEVRMFYLWR